MTAETAPAEWERKKGIALLLAAAVLLAGAVWLAFRPPPLPETVLTPEAVATCRTMLANAAEIDIVLARPAPNRIVVDERRWASLPPGTRASLLRAVSCDLWQTALPPGQAEVVAQGRRSGRRLGMLTSVGIPAS
jgi:hypothetical protein